VVRRDFASRRDKQLDSDAAERGCKMILDDSEASTKRIERAREMAKQS